MAPAPRAHHHQVRLGAGGIHGLHRPRRGLAPDTGSRRRRSRGLRPVSAASARQGPGAQAVPRQTPSPPSLGRLVLLWCGLLVRRPPPPPPARSPPLRSDRARRASPTTAAASVVLTSAGEAAVPAAPPSTPSGPGRRSFLVTASAASGAHPIPTLTEYLDTDEPGNRHQHLDDVPAAARVGGTVPTAGPRQGRGHLSVRTLPPPARASVLERHSRRLHDRSQINFWVLCKRDAHKSTINFSQIQSRFFKDVYKKT